MKATACLRSGGASSPDSSGLAGSWQFPWKRQRGVWRSLLSLGLGELAGMKNPVTSRGDPWHLPSFWEEWLDRKPGLFYVAFPCPLPRRWLTGTHRTSGLQWGRIPVGILDYLTMFCFFLRLTAPIFKTLILGIIYNPNLL